MNSIILFILCISTAAHAQAVPSPKSDEQTRLDLPSGTYSLDPETVRKGDMAQHLHNNYPLGRLIPVVPKTAGAKTATELKKQLQAATDNNNKNKAEADRSLQKSLNSLTEGQSVRVPTPATSAPTKLAEPVDFKKCVTQGLGLLKQKVRLGFILRDEASTDEERANAQRALESLQTRLQNQRGQRGMVCGQGDMYLEQVRPPDDLMQIKMLAALKQRESPAEQTLLRKTLAVTFGPLDDFRAKATWLALWNRLSLVAVFATSSLPSWQEILADIKDHPVQTSVAPTVGLVSIPVKVSLDTASLEDEYSTGLRWLEDMYGRR